MIIDKLFPYYQYTSVGNRTISTFSLDDPRFIRMSSSAFSRQQIDKLWKDYIDKRFELIHILPNDIFFIPNTTTSLVANLLSSGYSRDITINVLIHNIDYSVIAKRLVFEGPNKVFYNLGNGNYAMTNVITRQCISDALEGVATNVNTLNLDTVDAYIKESVNRIVESDDDDFLSAFNNTSSIDFSKVAVSSSNTDSQPAYNRIEAILRSNSPLEQTILLLGLSGIAKSAIIKAIVNKLDKEFTSNNFGKLADSADSIKIPLGMDDNGVLIEKELSYKDVFKYGIRLVDIRCGLMDYLDTEGLVRYYETPKGQQVYFNAPPENFLKCTDSYVLFARDMLEKLIAVRSSKADDLSESELEQLDKAIENYKEASKIPVLFFDEINRSSEPVRNAIMQLLNGSGFLNKTTKLCKFVAAANYPIGKTSTFNDLSDIDLHKFFSGTTQLDSTAISDRLNSIKLTPNEVFNSWLSWARGPGAIHESVLDHLGNSFSNRVYNIDFIYKYFSGDSEDYIEGQTPPYATYRAWELVSDYLKSVEEKEIPVNPDIIKGLLGEEEGKDFYEYLLSDRRFSLSNKDTIRVSKRKGFLSSDEKSQRREKLLNGIVDKLATICDPKVIKDSYGDDIKVSPLNDDVMDSVFNKYDPSKPDSFDECLGALKDYNTCIYHQIVKNIKNNNELDAINDTIKSIADESITNDNSKHDFEKDIKMISKSINTLIDFLTTYDLSVFNNSQSLFDYCKSIVSTKVSKKFLSFRDCDYLIRCLVNSAIENFEINNSIELLTDDFTKFVNEGLDTNTPIALIGISSVGKSTRVANYAKDHNYDFYNIPLASKTSMDILGMLSTAPLSSRVSKDIDIDLLNKLGIDTDTISESLSKFNLHEDVTVRAPNDELLRKIRRAESLKKPLIIFFDEVNRCTDKTLQSAIFEGISDNRLFGVSYDPRYIKIVIAGNTLDDSKTSLGRLNTLQGYDDALLRRFSVYNKGSYTNEDIQAIWSYMSDESKNYNGYSKYLVDWLKSLGVLRFEVLRQCVNSVEGASLINNSSSPRALRSLKSALESKYVFGSIFFLDVFKDIQTASLIGEDEADLGTQAENEVARNLSTGQMNDSIKYFTKCFKDIRDNIGNWACTEDYQFEIDGSTNSNITTAQLIESFRDFDHKFFNDNGKPNEKVFEVLLNKNDENYNRVLSVYEQAIGLLKLMATICGRIVVCRHKTIGSTIGQGDTDLNLMNFDIVKNFTRWYNTVSGRSDISLSRYTIPEIDSEDYAMNYIEQQFNDYGSDLRQSEWSKEIIEIHRQRGETLSSLIYLAAIRKITELDIDFRKKNVDNSITNLLNICQHDGLKKVILNLEDCYEPKYAKDYLHYVIGIDYNRYKEYKNLKSNSSTITPKEIYRDPLNTED